MKYQKFTFYWLLIEIYVRLLHDIFVDNAPVISQGASIAKIVSMA